MKAIEKAKELVDKFTITGNEWYNEDRDYAEAKQCALICVDEILEATKHEHINDKGTGLDIKFSEYWQEVKQEINKL